MKNQGLGITIILISSFSAWIYCIAVVVLGLIYQEYPGQESVAILISTLPTIMMMLSAFASTVILRVCNRKLVVIVSLLIAIVAGLLILHVDMPLMGVVVCSTLLGIPGGTIASANPTVLAIVAPPALKDKVLGWHNAFMMLGMSVFTLLGGVFAKTGRFQDGYKTVLLLIPLLILVVLFYPNVDKDRKKSSIPMEEEKNQTMPKDTSSGKLPKVVVGMLLLYLFGAIFWNAWFLNYSDYIVNEAQLGDIAMVGVIGSLCSIAGTLAGFVVAFWIKATGKFSMMLAFILTGVSMLLPQLTQNVIGCYMGGILCQFFNLIIVSGLTTYLGLSTSGKQATTAMSLLAGIEGSGVFLCGYVVPVIGRVFGGGAMMNIMVSGIILMIIGVAAYFVIKPTHKMVYEGK